MPEVNKFIADGVVSVQALFLITNPDHSGSICINTFHAVTGQGIDVVVYVMIVDKRGTVIPENSLAGGREPDITHLIPGNTQEAIITPIPISINRIETDLLGKNLMTKYHQQADQD